MTYAILNIRVDVLYHFLFWFVLQTKISEFVYNIIIGRSFSLVTSRTENSPSITLKQASVTTERK